MKQYYKMSDVKLRVGRIYMAKNHLKKKYKILKSNKTTGITTYYDYWDRMIRTGSRLQFIFDIAHRRIVLLKKKEKAPIKTKLKPRQRAWKGSNLKDKSKRVGR